MDTRNIFVYLIDNNISLINILKNLMYLHSTNGKGYKVNFITDDNINDYINFLPNYFNNLHASHKKNVIKVNVICEYGGIWLDSDTIVIDKLDSLFDIIDNKDGFFIKQNNAELYNEIFGSKKQTLLMIEWKNKIIEKLESCNNINQCIICDEIFNDILTNIYNYNSNLYDNYDIFNGLDNLYPVNFENCVSEYIDKPYDNYKNIIRTFQPLIVLVNSVYKKLENKTEEEILKDKLPINYFINKSFENMKLIDYDFIEIGTSNFDTLIELSDDNTKGISVDIIKYYLDQLPNKKNVKKINVGISNVNSFLDVYYIPEDVINYYNLPYWFKGCNCINDYHPLHIKHNVSSLCKIEKVNVITTIELFYTNSVRNVKYLKIDTEGHDCIILKTLFFYIKSLPDIFYPIKILFESNEHTNSINIDEIIYLFCSINYKLESRGHDTILIYDKKL
jgi:hypothetical protein